MEWKHKCSLDWLKERQKYLTASEIKKLLPVTATGRKRNVTDLDRLKVLSGKMVELTEEDTWSYGAAARGHLLEPYAIQSLNKMLDLLPLEMEKFYWWDDELVHVPGRKIAFSPDAMNVPMVGDYEMSSAIAEVKSYSAEKHLALAYTPKDKIEERWQIATAMALLPNIDHAYLVLFNPKMAMRKIFVIKFERDELKDEIDMILGVEDDWIKFLDSGIHTKKSTNGAFYSSTLAKSEEEIVKEILDKQRLNPV